jgi:hypothetical protein
MISSLTRKEMLIFRRLSVWLLIGSNNGVWCFQCCNETRGHGLYYCDRNKKTKTNSDNELIIKHLLHVKKEEMVLFPQTKLIYLALSLKKSVSLIGQLLEVYWCGELSWAIEQTLGTKLSGPLGGVDRVPEHVGVPVGTQSVVPLA